MQQIRIQLVLKDPFLRLNINVAKSSTYIFVLLFLVKKGCLAWPGLLSDLHPIRGAISVVQFENVWWYNFATFSPFLSYPWWRARVVEARGSAH